MIVLRSALFLVWFAGVSIVLHIVALPLLFAPPRAMLRIAQFWAAAVLFGLKWICGLAYEVRGKKHVPRGAALIASKHSTMWETIAFLVLVKDPAIVLKRTLTFIPLYGWYAVRMGMISVDRGGGGSAVRAMKRGARRALADNRQIVVFPEGTRRPVGAPPRYRPGIAGLYAGLGISCVPVAHTSGLFWLSRGFLKRPGCIIVEFLPAIPPGLGRHEFMAELQSRIETATSRLLGEARRNLDA